MAVRKDWNLRKAVELHNGGITGSPIRDAIMMDNPSWGLSENDLLDTFVAIRMGRIAIEDCN